MESIFDKLLEAYSVLYQKYHKSASFKDLPKCERVFLAVSTLILVKGLVQLTTGGASVFNAIVDMLIAGVLLFCIAKLPKIPRRYTNQQKNNELKEILCVCQLESA